MNIDSVSYSLYVDSVDGVAIDWAMYHVTRQL